MNILLSSSFPATLNSNKNLVKYIHEAFLNSEYVNKIELTDVYALTKFKCYDEYNLIFLVGSVMPDECDFTLLRSKINSTKTKLAFWMFDDPYEFDFKYRIEDLADFIFTNDRWSKYHYKNKSVYHLPLAASYKHHYREITVKTGFEIFFCGVAFPNRTRIINDSINILRKYNTYIAGSGWPSQYDFCKNRIISTDEMCFLYNSSLATLNIGRDYNLANEQYSLAPSTPGPRTFEAAMAGALQIFWVESLEILDYFKLNDEIILVNNVKDLEKTMDAITSKKIDTVRIRTASQQRAIRDHTYENRIQQCLKIIFGDLSK